MRRKIACETCDQLLDLPVLKERQQASCPRCESPILEFGANTFQKGIALSASALILLFSTLFFPMLGFSVRGQQRSMTLLDSGISLISNDETLLGGIVLLLIIALPCLMLILMIVLLGGILLQIHHPAVFWLGRGFYYLREWNMIEVYVVGMLVSLTKIITLATIELGTSFWLLIAFSICFLTAIHSVDRHHVWHSIKELCNR